MSSVNINSREQVARMDGPPEARLLASGLEGAVEPSGNGDNGEGRAERRQPPGEAAEGAPSPNGRDGRDDRGRFTPGNKGGPGNPFAREVAWLRKEMLEGVTGEDMKEIVRKAVVMAKEGNVQAMKFVFAYTIGKPTPAPDPDQLDLAEWQHFKDGSNLMYELPQMIMRMSPQKVLDILRFMRPEADAALGAKMSHALLHPETVMPQVPELVMGRKEKAPKGGAQERAGDGEGTASVDPRGSEYLASGLGGRLPVSEARRRAWGLSEGTFGLSPAAKGNRGGKKERKRGKGPSPNGDRRRIQKHGNGVPSRNGALSG